MSMKIKISGSEPIEYGPHDFQLGDYVYAPASLDDPQQGNLLSCVDSQDDEFVHCYFPQTCLTVGRNYEDLCLVPITEEWFKENPQVFTLSSDLKQRKEDLSFSYQYIFSAKRFNRKYHIAVYELNYEDQEVYHRLCREGLDLFTCLNESKGRATVAKIVAKTHHLSKENGLVTFGVEVMPIISIHGLQHFLRLCGCEELKIPQSLLED